jgi:hypothetical protein
MVGMMKEFKYYLAGLIVGALFSVLAVYVYEINQPEINTLTSCSCDDSFQEGVEFVTSGEYESRCSMRFPKNNITILQGVYSHPDYYCVWTEGRTPQAIAETTFHELAHYYAYDNSSHFCGRKTITDEVCEVES